jgi:hypothetical protein
MCLGTRGVPAFLGLGKARNIAKQKSAINLKHFRTFQEWGACLHLDEDELVARCEKLDGKD